MSNTDQDHDQVAEQVAHTIGLLYGGHQDDMPRVFPGSHEELPDYARVIVWESGTPPESWPIAFTHPDGAVSELARRLGVWFEPVHGCALAVYPAGDDAEQVLARLGATWSPDFDAYASGAIDTPRCVLCTPSPCTCATRRFTGRSG